MGKLYQPTTAEIAGLWTHKTPTSPGYAVFVKAEQLLANTNIAFKLHQGKLRVHDSHAKRPALLTGDTCTCTEFNELPFVMPQISHIAERRTIRHCSHTLAWAGYERILRNHYQTLRQYAPAPLQSTDDFRKGEHHLADLQAYLLFAEWLAGTPRLAASTAQIEQYATPQRAGRAAAQGTIIIQSQEEEIPPL